ncbi:MAG TPA: PilZ domain-containing protein [Thermoanaerobaculales bacterium]|nr:PilZ domain-containing protein [Thermoanaerobaculales bacterium]HPA79322.1 PilZ domain-containing protein [Thermoanaerobaculales bacterium]HQL30191.1 PilZ domain-containing protein [Thermoanaerobaculales bacterium]HQN96161.1 PilZ domain-containing protein [Thermoanaerobaculales bacterium]HQP42637.1 PilZ domain-containing protein [Thermoanaerobaculales bacterium]
MPGSGAIQVLVTRVDDATLQRVAETLRQIRVDLHRVRWDQTTLDLVQGTPFDVVIIGYPVSREALNRFLDAARTKGAACRRAGLVLITESVHSEAAQALIGRGANRVVTAEELENRLVTAVEDLASPAPRLPVRIPARVQLFADGRPLRLMAQVDDVSASGMLVRGVTQFPVGTVFGFEVVVPGEAKPIRGTAEIMRLTDPRREAVRGVGVRFVSFEGSDRLRLEMFIDRSLPQRARAGAD